MKFYRSHITNNVILLDYEMHEDNYAGTLIQIGNKNENEELRLGEYREDWSKEEFTRIVHPFHITITNYNDTQEQQEKVKLKIP